jgi:hypothetical protein
VPRPNIPLGFFLWLEGLEKNLDNRRKKAFNEIKSMACQSGGFALLKLSRKVLVVGRKAKT